MLINEKQQSFIQLRVVQGKSLEDISKEIDVPIHLLKEWSLTLEDHLEDMRLNEIDRISADFQIGLVQAYRELAELYDRLKKELDSRDFSGLPTDKLYYMFNDVQSRLMRLREDQEDDWDDFDDEFDEFDEFD